MQFLFTAPGELKDHRFSADLSFPSRNDIQVESIWLVREYEGLEGYLRYRQLPAKTEKRLASWLLEHHAEDIWDQARMADENLRAEMQEEREELRREREYFNGAVD